MGYKPQDVTNSLWAYASLSHHPGHDILERMAETSRSKLHKFKPFELVICLRAFATLGHHPGEEFLDAANGCLQPEGTTRPGQPLSSKLQAEGQLALAEFRRTNAHSRS